LFWLAEEEELDSFFGFFGVFGLPMQRNVQKRN